MIRRSLLRRPHRGSGSARRGRLCLTTRRAIVLGIAATSVGACADRSKSSDAESTAAVEWRIDSTPSLSIADDDALGEPVIGNAVGVSRLPDGGVIVADRGLSSLRFFAPDGSFVRSVGRKGSGPGEFDYIAWMHRCGDSLYVQDIGQEAVMVYALDGSLSRAPKYADIHGSRATYTSACNPSGIFIHNGWNMGFDRTPGRTRWTVPYWLTTTNGATRAELGEHHGSERLVIDGGSGPHPLGKNPVLAIGKDRAYVGTADSFLVQSFTLDGDSAGVLRNTDADLRTTPEDIERFKRLDTLGRNDVDKARSVREWSAVQFPPTVPAYDAMLVDARDHVWIRRFPRGIDTHAEWLVFAPSGEQVATLQMPGTLTVYEIGADYVLGIEVDPVEGRQMVRQYALRRAE